MKLNTLKLKTDNENAKMKYNHGLMLSHGNIISTNNY
jgi:hypothetical protein